MTTALSGRRVVVTRTSTQAKELCTLLAAAGARPVAIPVMRTRPLLGARQILELGARITSGEFQDVVFTSANAVSCLFEPGPLPQGSVRAYAIGPGTASSLERVGWAVERLPDGFIAESLLARIAQGRPAGRRMLLPRARGAREVLPDRLRALGAMVEEAELYETTPDWDSGPLLQAELESARCDCVTFASGSAARCFTALAGAVRVPEGCVLAAIGPVTAAVMAEVGLDAKVVANAHNMRGLVDALLTWYGQLPDNGGQP